MCLRMISVFCGCPLRSIFSPFRSMVMVTLESSFLLYRLLISKSCTPIGLSKFISVPLIPLIRSPSCSFSGQFLGMLLNYNPFFSSSKAMPNCPKLKVVCRCEGRYSYPTMSKKLLYGRFSLPIIYRSKKLRTEG